MSIREQILADIKEAMKNKDDFVRDTLRTINAALKQVEIDQRIQMSDEVVLGLLQKEIKKRQDSVELYNKGGRAELAQKELDEINLITKYLPKQLDENELEAVIKEVMAKVGASSIKDLGAVMKIAKDIIGASAEAKRISEMAKRLLG